MFSLKCADLKRWGFVRDCFSCTAARELLCRSIHHAAKGLENMMLTDPEGTASIQVH